MRAKIWILALCLAARAAAEIQFVGVMLTPTQKRFAMRAGEGEPSLWLTMGDSIGGFTIVAYEQKTDTITLKDDSRTLTLRLPESRVRIAKDDSIAGLKKVLNLPGAMQLRDLLHPKLQSLFKEEDVDSKHFPELLAPGVKIEVLRLSAEEQNALEEGLSAIERFLGVRPTHGLWVKTTKSGSMLFVVESGGSWFLAPSVPGIAPFK